MLKFPGVRPFRQNRAFTLVEVVIAMGIFGFAILAIFGMIAASNNSMRQSAFESRATLIARQIFDDLRQPLSDVSAQRIITGGSGQMPIPLPPPLMPPPTPVTNPAPANFGPCLYYFDGQTQMISRTSNPLVSNTNDASYAMPVTDNKAAYVVLVTGASVDPAQMATEDYLSQVLVTVEGPASSTAAKRLRQRFLSLVKLNK